MPNHEECWGQQFVVEPDPPTVRCKSCGQETYDYGGETDGGIEDCLFCNRKICEKCIVYCDGCGLSGCKKCFVRIDDVWYCSKDCKK